MRSHGPQALVADAEPRIAAAPGTAELESIRVELVGRKAPLVIALRELGSLPEQERRQRGAALNRARTAIEGLSRSVSVSCGRPSWTPRLRQDTVDITLPGTPHPRGYAHLIEQTAREILDIFVGFGYEIVHGPEVETTRYNLTR